MARILVTGAAGFIGNALCRALARRGDEVRGVTRTAVKRCDGVALTAIGAISAETNWRPYLAGIDIVVHLATSAHRPVSVAAGKVEAAAAAALARAAARAGVTRLVHMSSIRAMGETTPTATAFHAADPPRPRDAYGCAKLAIEQAVAAAAAESGLDLVMLRPPLVYGPGVKGNFRRLIAAAAGGWPLPIARLNTRRSLIYRDNLVELVALACIHPGASGRILLARDAVDLSLAEIVEALAEGFGRRARLFGAPPLLLSALARLPRLGADLRRLMAPLRVDDGETRALLGWSPAIAPEVGLATTARAFAEAR